MWVHDWWAFPLEVQKYSLPIQVMGLVFWHLIEANLRIMWCLFILVSA